MADALHTQLFSIPTNGNTPAHSLPQPSHYSLFTHDEWAKLGRNTPLPLSEYDITRLSALGDPIDLTEADAIYRPLSALLQMYTANIGTLQKETSHFLGRHNERTPFVIGIAGSVAAGKSTTARLLQELLRRWPATPSVELVTTDGFLYPNEELEKRNLMNRKGFPESYDQGALYHFVRSVKSGDDNVKAPIYDHITYNIVPDKYINVSHPDILIIEGLNVLAPPHIGDPSGMLESVADLFDLSIYVDAHPDDLERWYIQRIHRLRNTAFTHPHSYFKRYAHMPQGELEEHFRTIWRTINLPNLLENIAPTRSRADIVLSKGPDHTIEQVAIRKL